MANNTDQLTDEMEAMAVWENHLKAAANKWKEGVSQSEDEYRQGLASFLGVGEDEISQQVSHQWEESVTQMSPEEFANSITGEGDDWLIGLYEGVTGKEAPQDVRDLAKQIDDEVIAQSGEGTEGAQLAENIRQEIQNRVQQSG